MTGGSVVAVGGFGAYGELYEPPVGARGTVGGGGG